MIQNHRMLLLFFIIIILHSISVAQEKTKDSLSLNGPYFGQKPPGLVPEVFAPGFISTEAWEAAGTFSPDGKEYFFTRRPTEEGRENRLYYTKLENGRWTEPEFAPFAKDIFEMEPHVIPNGDVIFFNSERPKPAGIAMKGEIWYAEKKGDRWSEAKFLNSPVNDGFTMYVSATKDRTIYFTGSYNRKYGLYRSKLVNGKYGDPEYLPEPLNDIRGSSHPFLDPDENFLIFDAQVSGPLKPELFISYKKIDGSWTKAINMGPMINATKTEFGASVSPDGKYLFFHRAVDGNGDIYWVDAKIINDLHQKEFQD